MQDTAGEARTNSSVMYSYGPLYMAKQKQDNQLEHTYSSYVRIRDVALKTCQKRSMIGWNGERGSGISVLAARHDDDMYFMYLLFIPLLGDIFLSHWQEKSTVTMCNFFVFLIGWDYKYLINVFIFPFLTHTQSSHYYWDDGSFKVPHFFQILFSGLCNYLYSLIHYYLLALAYQLEGIFFIYSP